jgi:Ca2+-binding RTX toxin-like protein
MAHLNTPGTSRSCRGASVTASDGSETPRSAAVKPSYDIICAGAGNDQVNGRAGNDRIYGQDGSDTISGGAGADTLDGGNGNDHLSGGAGADTLAGDGGNDTLAGGAGSDHLSGAFNDGEQEVLRSATSTSRSGGVTPGVL